jgi:hypothetical protein
LDISSDLGLTSATEADLLALPDEGRGHELIDGMIVEKQSGFRHGRAQLRLRGPLGPYDRRSSAGGQPGGWWFPAEQLVRFEEGRYDAREPRTPALPSIYRPPRA